MEPTKRAKLLLISCNSGEVTLTSVFDSHKCESQYSESGSEGLTLAATTNPDIIVADLPLPDMPGAGFILKLREWSLTPVVVLSDPSSDNEKEAALLEAGADDYLAKPFGSDEFRARIGVALKHGVRLRASGPRRMLGNVMVDLATRSVTKDGAPVYLSGLQFDILAELVRSPGRVVTHAQILNKLWLSGDKGNVAILRAYVSMLRKKLCGPEDNLIETIPSIGYRLVVPVQTLAAS